MPTSLGKLLSDIFSKELGATMIKMRKQDFTYSQYKSIYDAVSDQVVEDIIDVVNSFLPNISLTNTTRVPDLKRCTASYDSEGLLQAQDRRLILEALIVLFSNFHPLADEAPSAGNPTSENTMTSSSSKRKIQPPSLGPSPAASPSHAMAQLNPPALTSTMSSYLGSTGKSEKDDTAFFSSSSVYMMAIKVVGILDAMQIGKVLKRPSEAKEVEARMTEQIVSVTSQWDLSKKRICELERELDKVSNSLSAQVDVLRQEKAAMEKKLTTEIEQLQATNFSQAAEISRLSHELELTQRKLEESNSAVRTQKKQVTQLQYLLEKARLQHTDTLTREKQRGKQLLQMAVREDEMIRRNQERIEKMAQWLDQSALASSSPVLPPPNVLNRLLGMSGPVSDPGASPSPETSPRKKSKSRQEPEVPVVVDGVAVSVDRAAALKQTQTTVFASASATSTHPSQLPVSVSVDFSLLPSASSESVPAEAAATLDSLLSASTPAPVPSVSLSSSTSSSKIPVPSTSISSTTSSSSRRSSLVPPAQSLHASHSSPSFPTAEDPSNSVPISASVPSSVNPSPAATSFPAFSSASRRASLASSGAVAQMAADLVAAASIDPNVLVSSRSRKSLDGSLAMSISQSASRAALLDSLDSAEKEQNMETGGGPVLAGSFSLESLPSELYEAVRLAMLSRLEKEMEELYQERDKRFQKGLEEYEGKVRGKKNELRMVQEKINEASFQLQQAKEEIRALHHQKVEKAQSITGSPLSVRQFMAQADVVVRKKPEPPPPSKTTQTIDFEALNKPPTPAVAPPPPTPAQKERETMIIDNKDPNRTPRSGSGAGVSPRIPHTSYRPVRAWVPKVAGQPGSTMKSSGPVANISPTTTTTAVN
eukprot:GILI01012167.1.p1 GENE.GILI01012167.1~~GILI01012167.1.p1  ORF type:complete len:878 (+),score=219.29 GILI01012167.1:113-2746(+)